MTKLALSKLQPTISPDALRDAALRRYIEACDTDAGEADDGIEDAQRRLHGRFSPLVLSQVVRLAKALASMADPSALRPGIVVILRSDGEERGLEQRLQRPVFPAFCEAIWPGRLLAFNPVDGPDLSSSLQAHELNSLEGVLLLGATVIAQLKPDAIVPDELRSIALSEELSLPTLTPGDIAAMLHACGTPVRGPFNGTGAAGPSVPADLTYLTTTNLAQAWAGETAAGVFTRLETVKARVHRQAVTEPALEAKAKDAVLPRLRDIHGLGPVRQQLERVVADVHAWRNDRLDWSKVGASFLLYGPPGVGKTSVAHAIATEIGGKVIDLSYTTVQATRHLGKMLAALDAGVELARTSAPAVVLVDEADCLSHRIDTGDHHGSNDRRSVVNGYLTRLTMLASSPGVVVILATNDPDQLDAALIRAGRCDHHIALHRPDRAALSNILLDNLGDRAAGDLTTTETWTNALDSLAGGTGADAAHFAREAIAVARAC